MCIKSTVNSNYYRRLPEFWQIFIKLDAEFMSDSQGAVYTHDFELQHKPPLWLKSRIVHELCHVKTQ